MATQAVIVIDEGTTSTRAVLFDEQSRVIAENSFRLNVDTSVQGRVEQDATEMLTGSLKVVRETLKDAESQGYDVSVMGISSQRSTTVLWDRQSGKPVAPIISWQDTRCEERVQQMKQEWGEACTERTGLQLQPANLLLHLSSMLEDPTLRERAEAGELLAGTPDTWLIWSLTGGNHFMSASSAGSAGGFDFIAGSWWTELVDELEVPLNLLPRMVPDDADFGTTTVETCGAALKIRSAFADQHAALFGHGGFEVGAAKCTHGTGSFVDFNIGAEPRPLDGLDMRIAWERDGRRCYMYEGSSFVTGSAVEWLVNELGVLESADQLDAVCASTPDSHGVVCVPALAGFTAPYWDQASRGSVFGLSRGITGAHLVRATVDGIAATIADVVRFMASTSGTSPDKILADGGLSRSDALLQSQADFTGAPVVRAAGSEHVTARGAAWMAGVAAGVWTTPQEAAANAEADSQEFVPSRTPNQLEGFRRAWDDAIKRTLGWKLQTTKEGQA